ncbi:MAG: CBS domain-containing protein [Desulfuromonadales bacterium]|nr:CBS domain-containing protein [Desulfuromonadales bacterium]
MDIITTHINADFDCLGSMIAARRLYPEAELVFPGGQERSLRQFFLKSVQYAYGFKRLRDIDLECIERLVLVDVSQSARIGPFARIATRPGVELHIYDHHPPRPGDLCGAVQCIEPVGATVTIFCRLFMERGLVPTPDEATMMMLGLYEDTGSLTFNTTTGADYRAAAFLLDAGANLNTVADLLVQDLTRDQVRLLNDLIANQSVLNVHGIDVTVAHASIDYFVSDIATLVHKLKEMENLDALFVAVRMESRVFMIARSRVEAVPVGEILAEFGGGGHAAAASCTVRDQTLLQILERLPQVLQRHVRPSWQVGQLMSAPVKSVTPDETIASVHRTLSRFNINAVPVVETGRVLGVITRQLVDKAVYHGLQDQLAREYMLTDFHSVEPQTPVEVLKNLVVESNQRFVPVVRDGLLVGAVTRTDLLRHMASGSGARPGGGAAGLLAHGGKQYKPNQVRRLMRNRLPGRVQQQLTRLGEVAAELGVSVYVVGGFVRDLLLNQENLDLDIVVEGDGIVFAEAFAADHNCRVRCHRKFGTAVIIHADGFKIDVASARMEFYLHPGALPDVEHASLKMDLYRRDFTINTLAICLNPDRHGELLDYYGGQRDVSEGAVRVLHNLSFVEDPTRMFRAVRFEQRLGFSIGKQTEHLLRSAVRLGLLDKVSGKRLYSELCNILNERDPLPAIERLYALDLLAGLHPRLAGRQEFSRPFAETRRAIDWYELLYTGRSCQSWLCYLLVLTAPLDTTAIRSFAERLQLPSRLLQLLTEQRHEALALLRRLERRHARSAPRDSSLYRWFEALPTELLLTMMALTGKEQVRQWLSRFISQLRSIEPLINGHDLARLGIPPGPAYKAILDELFRAQLDGRATSIEELSRLALRRAAKEDCLS